MWERWVETGTDSYIDPSSSLDHSSTFFHLGLGCSSKGHWRTQPSASWFSLWHSCLNQLKCRRHLHIFFHNAHLLPLLLPPIYTGASLIDGSVNIQQVVAEERENGVWTESTSFYGRGERNLRRVRQAGTDLDIIFLIFCCSYGTWLQRDPTSKLRVGWVSPLRSPPENVCQNFHAVFTSSHLMFNLHSFPVFYPAFTLTFFRVIFS